jgi:ligand-binding sensor domain-containing protein/two-component sensor histidine kinase
LLFFSFIKESSGVLPKRAWIFPFALLPFLCPAQPANNIRFNHFSSNHSLSQTFFQSILQDRKGYMWFGSYTGLVKFDGYNLTTFKFDPDKKNSLPDNSVVHLWEDREENIWMASDNYPLLSKYNIHTGKFTAYRHSGNNKSPGLPGYVSCLVTDKTGRLWIGTDEGLCFYEPISDKIINLSNVITSDTLCSRNINCLMVDHNGLLWIGTGNGINIYDPVNKKIKAFNPKDKNYPATNKEVLSILEDHSGDIWIGLWWTSLGNRGIYRYNPSIGISKIDRHSANDPNSISAGALNMLIEDSHNTIWGCMYEGGLWSYLPATDNFKTYRTNATDPYALNSNQIMNLFEDRSGVLWIATNGGGLNNCYLSNKKFTVYNNYDKEYISHYPLSLYKDHAGKIYVTTFGAGVHEFNPGSGDFKSYRSILTNDELTGFNYCYGLLEASDGNLWAVSFNEGLHQLDRKTGKITTVHSISDNLDTTVHNISNCIAEDLNRRLWIGTNNGLKCYNLQTKKYSGFEDLYRDTNQLSDDIISNLYCDHDGILWIAGTRGLATFDTKTGKLKIFKQDENGPVLAGNDKPNYFFDDENGTIWIGTNGGGLNKFNKKTERFTAYTMKDGLPDNSVYGILEDADGNLWLGTNKGLCKFTPPSLTNSKPVCRNYNMSDGLPGDEFMTNTCVKSDDGTLYFGNCGGLIAFKPGELKDNLFIPPVVITDFSLFNTPVSPNDSTGILKMFVDETKEIKLSYKQNDFSFTFSALSYVHAEKNQYAYKLVGYDKDWIHTDATKRFANYTNLDAGEYTFMVKASNNDGVWNETPTSIKLTIAPPYWQTWWFTLLCILIAAFIVYGIVYSRMHKMRDIRRIRNKIASDLHDDLGATLSSISIMSELANQQIKGHSPQTTSLLDKIGSSSRNMIESVNDMVWAINPKNDSFENIITRMRTFASEILAAKDIAFHFDFDKNLVHSKLKMDVRKNFYLIFKEAVNNLAKYSGAANAFVMIWNRDNNLKMTIRDDGNGFDIGAAKAGNGLNNMHQRAEMMAARFNIESIAGKGTTVEIEFKTE